MLMQHRLCRLDINFSNVDAQKFEHYQMFVPPYREEQSDHFVKRLLTIVALAELQPHIYNEHALHKVPDLQLSNNGLIQLWVQVDVPDEKHLRRACHRSDVVLLCTDYQQQHKLMDAHHYRQVVTVVYPQDLLADMEQWLKPVMQWSVWRDGDNVQLTDGTELHQFAFPYAELTKRLN